MRKMVARLSEGKLKMLEMERSHAKALPATAPPSRPQQARISAPDTNDGGTMAHIASKASDTHSLPGAKGRIPPTHHHQTYHYRHRE